TYVPGDNVTFQVTRPRKRMPVAFRTPGPMRWKFSVFERSFTVTTAGIGPVMDVIFVPSALRSEILRPGPTLPCSCTGVATVPTVNEPCITFTCASHWNVYVPSVNVTLHVTSTISSMLVAWSTPPGPERWKLWIVDRSCTWIVYVPGSRWWTGFP